MSLMSHWSVRKASGRGGQNWGELGLLAPQTQEAEHQEKQRGFPIPSQGLCFYDNTSQ